MLKIPRVALLLAAEEEQPLLRGAFHRYSYCLREVNGLHEVIQLHAEEGAPFDLIAIPLQLFDQTSGVSACIQARTTPELSSTPIMALSSSRDKVVLQAFYNAGADVVFAAPFDADMVFMQIGALARLKRAFDEELNQSCHDSGLLHPVVAAFQSVREGLLLIDTNYNVIFANQAARQMLGIRESRIETDLAIIGEQFKNFLKQHGSLMQGHAPTQKSSLLQSSHEANVRRVNGDAFKADLSITSLLRRGDATAGYSLAITDLGEIRHLSNTLVQAQRTKSLCLLTTAACLHWLASYQRGGRIAAIPYIDQLLQQAPRSCPLNATLTALLEVIDLVSNPDVSVRVRIEQDLNLAVRASDFFQLIGHIVLYAVEYVGVSGEVLVETGANIPGEGVTITVGAHSRRITPFQSQDRISQLIQHDFLQVTEDSEDLLELDAGLLAAQKIAERYRTFLECQNQGETTFKVRLKLPIGAESR
ncbi:MAG: PAS domain-containing protein [Deltaproteobacteria bacterium]|nr:PAS domain-containing protein [Deltaproteobacteria bacterium]